MADLTDVCLRTLLKSQRTEDGRPSLGLVVTEFVSSRALCGGDPRARRLLVHDPSERPLSIQIYGAEPKEMAEAARIAADAGADILDINMGCPVSKITGHGSGAALLRDPARAVAMVAAVSRATPLPVTVKMRAGWGAGDSDPVDLARRLCAEGVAMLAVHPRTREDGYAGRPREEVIAAIKAAVAVPVLGNGDILTASDAHGMLRRTACDGVMVGRGALKNPRIFCEILGDGAAAHTGAARLGFARAYVDSLCQRFGPDVALHRGRKLVGLCFKDEPAGRAILHALGQVRDVPGLLAILDGDEPAAIGPLQVDAPAGADARGVAALGGLA